MLLLGSFIPQTWMYATLQSFEEFTFPSIMAFYSGLGGCLFAAAILWFVKPDHAIPRRFAWVAGGGMCLVSVYGAAPSHLGEPVTVLLSMVGGVCVAWCFLQWFLVYSLLGLKDAVGYVLVSFSLVALATLILILFSNLLGVSEILLLAPFPVLAVFLCEQALTSIKKPQIAAQSERKPPSSSPQQFHLRQIVPISLELAVYALVLGVLRGQGAEASNLDIAIALNISLRILFPLVCFLWIGLQFKPKCFIDVSHMILIFIIISLLALTLLGDAGAAVAAALVSLARNVVLVLLSVMLLYLAHSSSYHPFTVYGLGRFVQIISTQIGFFITMTFGTTDSSATISLNIIFFILSCIFLFLANRSVKTIQLVAADEAATVHTDAPYGAVPVNARCDELAEEFGLTERELTIMKLICKGRSRSYIAEILVISENTVRWHGKRLYTKLDIHSKQELLTMVGLE